MKKFLALFSFRYDFGMLFADKGCLLGKNSVVAGKRFKRRKENGKSIRY